MKNQHPIWSKSVGQNLPQTRQHFSDLPNSTHDASPVQARTQNVLAEIIV